MISTKLPILLGHGFWRFSLSLLETPFGHQSVKTGGSNHHSVFLNSALNNGSHDRTHDTIASQQRSVFGVEGSESLKQLFARSDDAIHPIAIALSRHHFRDDEHS